MNRDKKNLQTRQKIMDSALREFSEKSYGEASINTICTAGEVSKGTIYHYFKDKDELYLICVKECFDALTAYLENLVSVSGASVEDGLERYFDGRIAFFGSNPLYLKIFCNSLISPPVHLLDAISEIKADFDSLNLSVLTTLLETVKLRSDVTIEEVVEVFREYQDFVNTRFQMQAAGESTLRQHEERCRRSLKILLYGVMERDVSSWITQ